MLKPGYLEFALQIQLCPVVRCSVWEVLLGPARVHICPTAPPGGSVPRASPLSLQLVTKHRGIFPQQARHESGLNLLLQLPTKGRKTINVKLYERIIVIYQHCQYLSSSDTSLDIWYVLTTFMLSNPFSTFLTCVNICHPKFCSSLWTKMWDHSCKLVRNKHCSSSESCAAVSK